MDEINDVDRARPLAQVRQLYATAKQLGFRDDMQHWSNVLWVVHGVTV